MSKTIKKILGSILVLLAMPVAAIVLGFIAEGFDDILRVIRIGFEFGIVMDLAAVVFIGIVYFGLKLIDGEI